MSDNCTPSPIETLETNIETAETCCDTNTTNLENNQATLNSIEFDIRLTQIFVGIIP